MAAGADYILNNIFVDGVTPTADNVQVGSICVTDADINQDEAETASDFDGDNGLTSNNCKRDSEVTFSNQVATIGPLVFDAGDTNFADDTTIKAVGICTVSSTGSGDYNNCANGSGILFAQVDLQNDITVGAGETLAITYTFDMLP
jgi:hypothetical protein